MRAESILIPALRATATRPWLNRLLFARDPWGNPFADENRADPSAIVARMWEDGPVTNRPFWGRWFVVGHEECLAALTHDGTSAGQDVDALFDAVRPYRRLAPTTKGFFRRWLLLLDGADHHRVRGPMARAFTPRRIAALADGIRDDVDELLAAIERQDEIDLVAAFNRPLPRRTLTRLLGVPTDLGDELGDLAIRLAAFLDPVETFDVDDLDTAVREFHASVGGLVAARRERPGDDLVSELAADPATALDELVANVGLLLFAGHDTTTGFLGTAALALAEHPDQRALVAEDPDLWENAIEELLRWDPPVGAVLRRVTADLELGTDAIPAGASLSIELWAANRDPRRWDDPWELRLDRPDPRPLAFGFGAHHCVGAALARLQARIALQAMVERLGEFTIDRDRIEWRRSALLRGPTFLPLRPG